MPRYAFCVSVTAGLALAAAVLPWSRLARVSRPRTFCDEAALTVTGHLRRRPDQAAERRLRALFAELDRDLAAVLGDRTVGARPIGLLRR